MGKKRELKKKLGFSAVNEEHDAEQSYEEEGYKRYRWRNPIKNGVDCDGDFVAINDGGRKIRNADGYRDLVAVNYCGTFGDLGK